MVRGHGNKIGVHLIYLIVIKLFMTAHKKTKMLKENIFAAFKLLDAVFIWLINDAMPTIELNMEKILPVDHYREGQRGRGINLSKTATLHDTKIGFQYQLSLNAGQKYCRMLQYFRPSLRTYATKYFPY